MMNDWHDGLASRNQRNSHGISARAMVPLALPPFLSWRKQLRCALLLSKAGRDRIFVAGS